MSDVVVGVDESDGAAQALRWAVREGELHGWTVTALLAWGFLDQHQTIVGETFDPSYGEKEALEALATIVGDAVGETAAANVERRAVCDLPARALLDAAAGSELLVVGARGLGGFRGLLLGSVSQHCLHHGTSPIAVVRDHDGTVDTHGQIVVAVDGSDTARRALAWALEEARLRKAALTVVNAWHSPYVGGYPYVPYTSAAFEPGVFEDGSKLVLDEALAACDTAGVEVERISAQGTPAGVVLDAATSASLVVMGSRGLGGFKGMLLGSATHQVTHHAPCPVVVIPPAS